MIGNRDAIRKLKKAGAEILCGEDGGVALVRLADGRQYKTLRNALVGLESEALQGYGSAMAYNITTSTKSYPNWMQTMVAEVPRPRKQLNLTPVAKPVVRRLRVGET